MFQVDPRMKKEMRAMKRISKEEVVLDFDRTQSVCPL